VEAFDSGRFRSLTLASFPVDSLALPKLTLSASRVCRWHPCRSTVPNASRAVERLHNSLFLHEMPNTVPILAGRVSAQGLNALNENT
jgi:hypothetical protein